MGVGGVRDLSTRQRQILEFIQKSITERGYPPSVREIGQAVGLSSSSTVHAHLTALEKKGLLRRDPTKPRAIEVLDDEAWMRRERLVPVPVLGQVTAGKPILAVENVEDTYPLPFDLVRDEDVFMLRVRGDSMIEAGILEGDLVLVRQQNHADDGDIVVALLGDEATVKRFFRDKDYIRLQPENPYMEPIIVKDVRILGKVIGLYRRIR